jgi:hypothetical protein
MMKLQLIARSEIALAQLNARRMASRSALFSVALVFLLLGLGMLTLAVYSALLPHLGAPLAALTVSIIDTVIGLVFILVARKAGPSENEEKLAREIRDMAYAELGKDVDQMKGEIDQITGDINRIRTGFTSFTSGAAGTLGPVVSMLLKVAKRD